MFLDSKAEPPRAFGFVFLFQPVQVISILSNSQHPIRPSALVQIMTAIERGDFDGHRGTIHGVPAWAWAMELGHAQAVEVAIDRSMVVDGCDKKGRSFLVAALDEGLPMGMIALGLAKSSDGWWMPGPDGRDVFSHPGMDVAMANAIGQRLWAQGLWRRVRAHFGGWPGRPAKTRAMRALASWIPDNG